MFDDYAFAKVAGIVLFVLALGGAFLVGCPKYHVWSAEKEGEAEFQKAEQNRRITVLEAQALMDSAHLKAQAEIERAKGIAEANRIVSDGLKGHEEYLRYLWIDKVAANAGHEVIYVPTEANLPILEARPRGGVTPAPIAEG